MKFYYKYLIAATIVFFAGYAFLNIAANREAAKPSADPVVSSPTVDIAAPKPEVTLGKKTVKRLSIDPQRTLILNAEVGGAAVEAIIQHLQMLNTVEEAPIYILLDSPGGSVFDGARLISFMEASRSPIYTIVYGMCASMCAQISQYGKERYMIDRSVLMFHPAAGGLQGQLEEMESVLSFVRLNVDKLDAHVADRAKIDRKTFKAMIQNELWLSSDEALKLNLIDKIVTFELDTGSKSENFNLRQILGPKVPTKSVRQTILNEFR